MPIKIEVRCAHCHQLKGRSEFPQHVVGRDSKTGRPKRQVDLYCTDCKTRFPGLAKQEKRDLWVPDR
jgi:hypothetical protein